MTSEEIAGDPDSAKRTHLGRISEAHQQLIDTLRAVEQSNLPPDLAFIDAEVEEHPLKKVHSDLFYYYEEIATYEDRIRRATRNTATIGDEEVEYDLFTVDFYKAEVPAETTVKTDNNDSGTRLSDYYDSMESNFSQLRSTELTDEPEETEQIPISLETLPRWQGWTRTYEKSARINGQLKSRTFKKRLVVPIAGVWKAFGVLTDCLDILGFTAEAQEGLPIHRQFDTSRDSQQTGRVERRSIKGQPDL